MALYIACWHDAELGFEPDGYSKEGTRHLYRGPLRSTPGRVHSGGKRDRLRAEFGELEAMAAIGVYDLLRQLSQGQVLSRRGWVLNGFGAEVSARQAAVLIGSTDLDTTERLMGRLLEHGWLLQTHWPGDGGRHGPTIPSEAAAAAAVDQASTPAETSPPDATILTGGRQSGPGCNRVRTELRLNRNENENENENGKLKLKPNERTRTRNENGNGQAFPVDERAAADRRRSSGSNRSEPQGRAAGGDQGLSPVLSAVSVRDWKEASRRFVDLIAELVGEQAGEDARSARQRVRDRAIWAQLFVHCVGQMGRGGPVEDGVRVARMRNVALKATELGVAEKAGAVKNARAVLTAWAIDEGYLHRRRPAPRG